MIFKRKIPTVLNNGINLGMDCFIHHIYRTYFKTQFTQVIGETPTTSANIQNSLSVIDKITQ